MPRLLRGPWFCLGLILVLNALAGCGGDGRPDVPTESVVVDIVTGLVGPVGNDVIVHLLGGTDVTLELGTPLAEAWRQALAHSQQYSHPVYLEIAPETRRILYLALPIVSPVEALVETEEAVEVALVYSAAVHYLYRTNPGFEWMFAFLRGHLASGDTLVVTEKDGQGIVDVRTNMFLPMP